MNNLNFFHVTALSKVIRVVKTFHYQKMLKSTRTALCGVCSFSSHGNKTLPRIVLLRCLSKDQYCADKPNNVPKREVKCCKSDHNKVENTTLTRE